MTILTAPMASYTLALLLLLISFAALINLGFLVWESFSWDKWGRKAMKRDMLKERGREDD